MQILRSKRVLTAIVGLIAAVAAVYGTELPQEELTQAVLTIVGAAIGLLGGYGAARARG